MFRCGEAFPRKPQVNSSLCLLARTESFISPLKPSTSKRIGFSVTGLDESESNPESCEVMVDTQIKYKPSREEEKYLLQSIKGNISHRNK